MPADLIVRGGPLWTGVGGVIPAGLVAIAGDTVEFAGPEADYRPDEGEAPRVLEAGGGLILPGLINAHCHGPMVLFRGLSDDTPLEVWLAEHMFPAEAATVSDEMTFLCGQLAAAEMLLGGVTCVQDAYFCAGGLARAHATAGMRAVVAQGIIDFPASGVPDPAMGIAVARDFIHACRDLAPLVTPAVFPHSAYTCSPAKLRAAAELAADEGVPLYIHLAESRGELAAVQEAHGTTPGRHLEAVGVLEALTAGVHGVWLDDEELELLAQRGVGLVHCPESNMKLASGAARVEAWRRAGISAGLGTDGAASNNDLDMIGEMASACRLAKVTTGDPAALPAGASLEMALAGGAKLLGLEGRVGRLAPGYAADLVVLDLDRPHLAPVFDPLSHLVYAARGDDVRHVVVAGRQVVADRRLTTLDLPRIMAQVRELARQLA